MFDEASRAALLAYVVAGRWINSGEVDVLSRQLDAAFDQVVSTVAPLVAYRGMTAEAWASQDPCGRPVTHPGFLSMSRSEQVARFFARDAGLVVRIAVPVAARIIDIGHHLDGEYPLEQELLAPRGTVLRFARRWEWSGSFRVIDATMEQ